MRRIAFAVVFVIVAANAAWAQELPKPDDRYGKSYPRSLYSFPVVVPELGICAAGEYYEPVDTHLTKYVSRIEVAATRAQIYDECVWMRTRRGDRWVLRPKGTIVAMDAKGRDLFDYGSPNGRRCANPRPVSIPIPPATAEIPEFEEPPALLPIPAPPKLQIPEVPDVEQSRPQLPTLVVIKKRGRCQGGSRTIVCTGLAIGVGILAWQIANSVSDEVRKVDPNNGRRPVREDVFNGRRIAFSFRF